jgi:hypothetical protein
MGGASQSDFGFDRAAGAGCFFGTVTTEQNGGFCSCSAATDELDLTGARALTVTAKAQQVPRLWLRNPGLGESLVTQG